MKIHISMDLFPEAADPDHETGLSEMGYERFMDFLMGYGEDIDIRRDTDE